MTGRRSGALAIGTLWLLAACQSSAPRAVPRVTVPRPSSPVTAAPVPSSQVSAGYDPAHDLGALFHAVQMARLFPDSKTFVDARAVDAPATIVARYEAERGTPGFDLREFVTRWFESPGTGAPVTGSAQTTGMEQHIRDLWTMLTRAADTPDARSSLIPLPESYVVPGGRFREVYYWDSYFTMLGLIESGRTDLVKNMLDNFAHLITTVGHIPNGNRTYYRGRSQPPYFAAMVGLYARATDPKEGIRYLPAMEKEYAYWMDGASRLTPGTAYRRVVKLPGGAVMNRYWDDIPEPRPESYREDFELGESVPAERREALFRNIRAAAESGWDFSSRWMRDTTDLRTLETIDLAPVDLNSLLWNTETSIAALRQLRDGPGDAAAAATFRVAADARRQALLESAWDPAGGFFFDVRWRTGERVTDRPTMAAASPLFFGLATAEQGRATAARLEREFLRAGGFVTTLIRSGQQWDAPNGWPPLQWMGMEGARRYGRADLADAARDRWLAMNRRVYAESGKMTEKYDVLDLSRPAGGGEYPTQDGFGWTNGVALALAKLAAVR